MDWDPVSCCWAVLLNHVLSLSLWNCLHEASLPIYPCKNLTGEAKRGLQEIFYPFHKWSAGCAQTSTEKATNSTIHLLGFATLGVVPSEPKDSGLPPLTSSLCSPHQLALTGDRFFFKKSNSLHTLSWSCFSYWQLLPCSSLRLAARTGRTSSALRFCLPHCADFHSANKVI